MEKDTEFNNQDSIGNSLEQDRAWAESLLNKQSLSQFNASKIKAPLNYFESFPDQLMSRIESEKRQKMESDSRALAKAAKEEEELLILLDKQNRKENWLQRNIIVKIINKKL
jgi:hypothetical protein